MPGALRRRLLHWLKVPARPAPPPGDPAATRTFLASPGFLRYRTAVWLLKQLSALAALLFWFFVLTRDPFGLRAYAGWLSIAEAIAWITFLAQLPVSFALLRLDYDMRWYILSDRSLRIREGVVNVREKTLTFANVQNITIQQNPLQRLFGIADLRIRAAGGGAQAKSGSNTGRAQSSREAVFQGVDNAAEIRSIVRERLRSYRDAGLGDPDDRRQLVAAGDFDARSDDGGVHATIAAPRGPAPRLAADPQAVSTAAIAAARELLAEIRALRDDAARG